MNRKPIVIDASAVVQLLTNHPSQNLDIIDSMANRLAYSTEYWQIESASAFRRMLLAKEITDEIFGELLKRLGELHVIPVNFAVFSDRIPQHVRNISVYDAAYIALAEHMDVPLITFDAKMRKLSTTSIEFLPEPFRIRSPTT